MKIVVLDGFTVNPGDLTWDAFNEFGAVSVFDRSREDEIVPRMKGAEVVLTNKGRITDAVIAASPDLKYIGELATGYNNIDLAAAKARSIVVTNIPAYSTKSVVEMTFALLLEIARHTGAHDKAVHEKRWETSPDFTFWDYPLIELAGKTLGILGFGTIGQAVAVAANAFGMKVIAHSTHRKNVDEKVARQVSIDELFAASDIVTLHCPLTKETENLICKSSIAKMKDGVIIINTSRGPVINEADLADALNAGKVSAAAVDVVSEEPIKSGNPLLRAKNCIITPHIAWAPREARARLLGIAVDNLRAFLKGAPINVVNG